MRTVHKFPILPSGDAAWFEVDVPAKAKPVLVCGQMGRSFIWFELDTTKPRERRLMCIVPTGGSIPAGAVHVQSFMTNNGAFVWHVYEIAK